MTGAWGNGLPQPWHKRPQPTRLMVFVGELGLTGHRTDDSRPPRGRTMAHTVEVHTAAGEPVATAWFREGSFLAGRVGMTPGYRVGRGITPRESLEQFLRDVERAHPKTRAKAAQ